MKRTQVVGIIIASAVIACVTLTIVVNTWYAAKADNARSIMLAAFERIHQSPYAPITEQEVSALVGTPPVEGPVKAMTVRCKGGVHNDAGHPTQLRKWHQYGTELDVLFDDAGIARGVYISDPLSLHYQLEVWVSSLSGYPSPPVQPTIKNPHPPPE